MRDAEIWREIHYSKNSPPMYKELTCA